MMINKRSKIKKTSNPIDKRVGRRLRMQRRRLGMSQRALGAALGLKFQQIQNYECGACGISVSRLKKISEILGVPIAAWFSDDGLPAPAQETGPITHLRALELLRSQEDDAREFVANARTLRLLKSFARLTDDKSQALVLELCETLVAKR